MLLALSETAYQVLRLPLGLIIDIDNNIDEPAKFSKIRLITGVPDIAGTTIIGLENTELLNLGNIDDFDFDDW